MTYTVTITAITALFTYTHAHPAAIAISWAATLAALTIDARRAIITRKA